MLTTRLNRNGDEIDFIYEHYRHKDFIQHAIVITTDANRKVKRLYFNSCELGTLHVGRDGSVTCHRWETEDEAQGASAISKHFTTIGSVESKERELAEAIIRNVLRNIKEPIVGKYVRGFYDFPGTEVQIPAEYEPGGTNPVAENPPGPIAPPEPAAKPWTIPKDAPWRQSDYNEDQPGVLKRPDLLFGLILAAMTLLLALGFC